MNSDELPPIDANQPEQGEAFKNWFGDWQKPTPTKGMLGGLLGGLQSQFTAKHKASHSSVVLDDQGKPKPVYHGTMASFDAFDPKKNNPNSLFGPGFYFTEDQDAAQGYTAGNAMREHRADEQRDKARLIKAYLNIRNPFDADAAFSRLASAPQHAKFSYDFISDALGGNAKATQKLKDLGYDGITHTGGCITGSKPHKVWIAFEPNQIKSTDNEGTYNPSDPRMHKAQGGEVPEVPGVPRQADEVPIKAQAGEMVVKNGPSQFYRQQLDDMNAGREPHFKKGGPVGGPLFGKERGPDTGPAPSSILGRERAFPEAIYAGNTVGEPIPVAQRAPSIPMAINAADVPTALPAPEPPAREHSKPNKWNYGRGGILANLMGKGVHDIFNIPYPGRNSGGDSSHGGGGNGSSGGSDNTELVRAIEELTKEVRELNGEMKARKKNEPGIKPDGSFVPMGPKQPKRSTMGGFADNPVTPGNLSATEARRRG